MEPTQTNAALPSPPPPHVLIFPLPAQGHVNPMLKLAQLLGIAGLDITFLNSEYNHERLVRHTNIQERFAQYPGFHFRTIPDGLPADHPRSGVGVKELFESLNTRVKPILKDMLAEIRPRVSCIIGDGFMGFVVEVASELGIPIISFRTSGACSLWVYLSLPQVIEAGELVLQGNEDMDRPITKVPGMEGFLRYRDLPSFCRSTDMEDPSLQLVLRQARQSTRAQALIVNTFEDLEGPVLKHIRSKYPKTYSIGPLHQLLNTQLSKKKSQESSTIPQHSNSLWKVDRSSIEWLDRQPSRSVLYVSFGSLTILTRDQFLEFWYGIVSSKKRFLWVIRPDFVRKEGNLEDFPVELEEATKERGYMVEWAPQEEVLAHNAIGGFFTHSGWNSTLESIVAGVPMICWPFFGDQQVNSRFVSEVWKVGLDMKDACDRKIVEKMVNDLMVERREELFASATRMAQLARQSVSEEGPSFCNLNRLIEDMRLMSLQAHDHAQV